MSPFLYRISEYSLLSMANWNIERSRAGALRQPARDPRPVLRRQGDHLAEVLCQVKNICTWLLVARWCRAVVPGSNLAVSSRADCPCAVGWPLRGRLYTVMYMSTKNVMKTFEITFSTTCFQRDELAAIYSLQKLAGELRNRQLTVGLQYRSTYISYCS